MSWRTKPDGTLEAHVLDPKEVYFCVVGNAHSHLKCSFPLPQFHRGLQFSTSCNLLVEDLYYLLEGYLWRCPVFR